MTVEKVYLSSSFPNPTFNGLFPCLCPKGSEHLNWILSNARLPFLYQIESVNLAMSILQSCMHDTTDTLFVKKVARITNSNHETFCLPSEWNTVLRFWHHSLADFWWFLPLLKNLDWLELENCKLQYCWHFSWRWKLLIEAPIDSYAGHNADLDSDCFCYCFDYCSWGYASAPLETSEEWVSPWETTSKTLRGPY